MFLTMLLGIHKNTEGYARTSFTSTSPFLVIIILKKNLLHLIDEGCYAHRLMTLGQSQTA